MLPVAIFKSNCGQLDTLGAQGLLSISFPTNFAEVLKQENKAAKNY